MTYSQLHFSSTVLVSDAFIKFPFLDSQSQTLRPKFILSRSHACGLFITLFSFLIEVFFTIFKNLRRLDDLSNTIEARTASIKTCNNQNIAEYLRLIYSCRCAWLVTRHASIIPPKIQDHFERPTSLKWLVGSPVDSKVSLKWLVNSSVDFRAAEPLNCKPFSFFIPSIRLPSCRAVEPLNYTAVSTNVVPQNLGIRHNADWPW